VNTDQHAAAFNSERVNGEMGCKIVLDKYYFRLLNTIKETL